MTSLFRVIRSIRKSFRLRRLQQRISPQRPLPRGIPAFLKSADDRQRALEEYLDFCVADEGVSAVMKLQGLSRADLGDIYKRLMGMGLGGWVHGHFMPLSTISYAEPLLYVSVALADKIGADHIVSNLLQYWEQKIPQGGLAAQAQQHGHRAGG